MNLILRYLLIQQLWLFPGFALADEFVETPGQSVSEDVQSAFRVRGSSLSLSPTTLSLSSEDSAVLSSGSDQRARAQVAFLHDYHSGGELWKEIIPERFLSAVMRSDRNHVPGRTIDADAISLMSAVDVLRHSDGKFYVIEDNVSAATGLGMLEYIFSLVPDGSVISSSPHQYIIDKLVENGRLEANPVIVQIGYDVGLVEGADCYACNYSRWQSATSGPLRDAGVYIMTINPLDAVDNFFQANLGFRVFDNGPSYTLSDGSEHRLIVEENDQVFLYVRRRGEEVEKVKVDAIWPMVRARDLFQWAPRLQRSARAGQVELLQSPGIDILDNKILQSFVPEMIRLYLNEEPILSTPETIRFFGPDGTFDQEVFDSLFGGQEFSNYFFKKSTGEGGVGVVSGAELAESPAKLRRWKSKVRENPLKYLAQKGVDSSLLPINDEQFIKVDFRPYSFAWVGEGEISSFSLPYFINRGVAQDREGHNLSQSTSGAFVSVSESICNSLLNQKGQKI